MCKFLLLSTSYIQIWEMQARMNILKLSNVNMITVSSYHS